MQGVWARRENIIWGSNVQEAAALDLNSGEKHIANETMLGLSCKIDIGQIKMIVGEGREKKF